MFKKAALTLAVTITALAPAAAMAEVETPSAVTVQIDDLDLSTAQGQDRMDTRVKSAARQICGTASSRSISERKARRDCVEQVMADVMPQMELAVAKSAKALALNSFTATTSRG